MSSASKPKTFCEEGPTITHPKRARHDSDSGTEIDKDNISPPKRRKVKTPAFVVKDKEMRAFFRLMGESHSRPNVTVVRPTSTTQVGLQRNLGAGANVTGVVRPKLKS